MLLDYNNSYKSHEKCNIFLSHFRFYWRRKECEPIGCARIRSSAQLLISLQIPSSFSRYFFDAPFQVVEASWINLKWLRNQNVAKEHVRACNQRNMRLRLNRLGSFSGKGYRRLTHRKKLVVVNVARSPQARTNRIRGIFLTAIFGESLLYHEPQNYLRLRH